MKYRKKPVVIEAIKVADALAFYDTKYADLPQWLIDAHEAQAISFHCDGVRISTLEGRMTGGLDDWIIRGVKGELYPCKPDIFEATYEPAE